MSNRTYIATRRSVTAAHPKTPTSFLDDLIDAIDPLPENVFDVNALHDIYAVMKGSLGQSVALLHRKAVWGGVLRGQAACESEWNGEQGVDPNKKHPKTHPKGEKTDRNTRLNPSHRP